nr:MAG: hypothetical protein 1 [Barnaviridae sp.]
MVLVLVSGSLVLALVSAYALWSLVFLTARFLREIVHGLFLILMAPYYVYKVLQHRWHGIRVRPRKLETKTKVRCTRCGFFAEHGGILYPIEPKDIGKAKSCLEMAQLNSVVLRPKKTNQVISFTSGGQTFGCGFRATLNGHCVLITARHVLEYASNLEQVDLVGPNGTATLPRNAPVYLDAPDMDVMAVELPMAVFSGIGAANLKLGKLPFVGHSINCSWVLDDKPGFASGVIREVVPHTLKFLHSATTFPGCSGAPIFASGKVVGVHTGSDETYNIATSLNAFIREEVSPGQVEREKGIKLSEYGTWRKGDADYNDFTVVMGGKYMGISVCGTSYAYGDEDVFRGVKVRKGLNWADCFDGDDDLPSLWGEVRQGFQTSERSPSSSENTNGTGQKDKAMKVEISPVSRTLDTSTSPVAPSGKKSRRQRKKKTTTPLSGAMPGLIVPLQPSTGLSEYTPTDTDTLPPPPQTTTARFLNPPADTLGSECLQSLRGNLQRRLGALLREQPNSPEVKDVIGLLASFGGQ